MCEKMYKDTTEDNLCHHCQTNDATEPHPCPYKAEIGDDAETLCNCCADCEYECAQDI